MEKYHCKDCNKKFKFKSQYERHKKRKTPCSINKLVDTIILPSIEKQIPIKNKKIIYNENYYLPLPFF